MISPSSNERSEAWVPLKLYSPRAHTLDLIGTPKKIQGYINYEHQKRAIVITQGHQPRVGFLGSI